MLEIILERVLPGVIRLIVYISLGIALGWVLEALGVVRRLGHWVKPVILWAGLPPVCATAFVTALASQKAAGGMLSAAYSNQEISRRSLILGGAAISFPSAMMKLRFAAPLLITTLGLAGLAYTGFVIVGSALVLTVVMIGGHVWREAEPADSGSAEQAEAKAEEQGLNRPGWRVAWERWRHLLPRVLLVAVPVYTLVAVLGETGFFGKLADTFPPQLERFLPPEAMAVIVMQMGSTTRAVPVAQEFLNSGALSPAALFFALVTGYVISLPVRVMRRSLPSVLSLYPGRNGVWILVTSQSPRFLLGVILMVGWFIVQFGGSG